MQHCFSCLKRGALKKSIKSKVKQRAALFFTLLINSGLAFAQASESPVRLKLSDVIYSFVYGMDGFVIATIAIAGMSVACLKHVIEWKYFFYTIGCVIAVFVVSAIFQGISNL